MRSGNFDRRRLGRRPPVGAPLWVVLVTIKLSLRQAFATKAASGILAMRRYDPKRDYIMTRSGSSQDDNKLPSTRAFAWYGLAVILVASYVNSYDIWRWLNASIGSSSANVAPFIITATALAVAFSIARRGREWPSPAFVLGAAIALGALFLTNPDFPAKRIHVPQYMLLSLVLRRALFHGAIPEPALTGLSVAMAALFGIHDEFLQGFHPDRNFGLRDIGVNTLGALSGGPLASGFGLFVNGKARAAQTGTSFAVTIIAMTAATLLLVAPMEAYRGQTIPPWTFMPLLAACCVWALLPARRPYALPWHIAGLLAISLILYPLASHAIRFY
jgi:hypothetical protein